MLPSKIKWTGGRGAEGHGLQDPIYTASEYVLKKDLIWVILMRLSLCLISDAHIQPSTSRFE
jgi:hypothetical protein